MVTYGESRAQRAVYTAYCVGLWSRKPLKNRGASSRWLGEGFLSHCLSCDEAREIVKQLLYTEKRKEKTPLSDENSFNSFKKNYFKSGKLFQSLLNNDDNAVIDIINKLEWSHLPSPYSLPGLAGLKQTLRCLEYHVASLWLCGLLKSCCMVFIIRCALLFLSCVYRLCCLSRHVKLITIFSLPHHLLSNTRLFASH